MPVSGAPRSIPQSVVPRPMPASEATRLAQGCRRGRNRRLGPAHRPPTRPGSTDRRSTTGSGSHPGTSGSRRSAGGAASSSPRGRRATVTGPVLASFTSRRPFIRAIGDQARRRRCTSSHTPSASASSNRSSSMSNGSQPARPTRRASPPAGASSAPSWASISRLPGPVWAAPKISSSRIRTTPKARRTAPPVRRIIGRSRGSQQPSGDDRCGRMTTHHMATVAELSKNPPVQPARSDLAQRLQIGQDQVAALHMDQLVLAPLAKLLVHALA